MTNISSSQKLRDEFADNILTKLNFRLPDPVRHIKLGDVDATQTVTLMTQLGDTIACSFGNQIRLIHYPMLTDKED